MPLTPFHLGPALFLGLLFFSYIHLPTFFLASIILDIKPFLVLFFDLNSPLHGFFHSFLGGLIPAVILAFIMLKTDKKVQNFMWEFELKQKLSGYKILFSSVAGIYLHVLFDSLLYTDIKPFYPLNFNPFYNLIGFEIYLLCTLLFLAGIILYFYKSRS